MAAVHLTNGTHESGRSAHEVSQSHAHENSGNASAKVSLPCLFGAEFDERSPTQKEAEHVGHDVVDDHHHDGQDEVNQTLEQVLDDQVRLGHHDQQSDVGPGKQRKL